MKSKEAELLYGMALQKLELCLGTDSPSLAGVIHSIAYYLSEQQRYSESNPHFIRLITIRKKAEPEQAKEMLIAVKDFADSLRKQGREEEANALLRELNCET